MGCGLENPVWYVPEGKAKRIFLRNLSSRLLANGKQGGAKRGQRPPQNLKRAVSVDMQKCPGVLETEGWWGRGARWLPGPLSPPPCCRIQVRQMVVHGSLGIAEPRDKCCPLLPPPSTFLRAPPHPLPNAIHQKTNSSCYPPAVFLFS